jgi:hypothetical protein
VSNQVIVPAVVGAVALERRHQDLFAESIPSAVVGIGELVHGGVTNHWSGGAIEKGSVLHQPGVTRRVFKAAIVALHAERYGATFAGLERRGEMLYIRA